MALQTLKKTFRTSDGLEIYYELYAEQGSNAKPEILFVHGLGGDLDAWQYVIAEIASKNIPCMAMDLRGHGHSTHP